MRICFLLCQWMTAGRGVIHAEMPVSDGRIHGLQLWVNLKSADKMVEPQYQELKSKEIPKPSKDGVTVSVISGEALGVKVDGVWSSDIQYQRFPINKILKVITILLVYNKNSSQAIVMSDLLVNHSLELVLFKYYSLAVIINNWRSHGNSFGKNCQPFCKVVQWLSNLSPVPNGTLNNRGLPTSNAVLTVRQKSAVELTLVRAWQKCTSRASIDPSKIKNDQKMIQKVVYWI